MKLTDKAEALWASYEAEVGARLGRRDDVDVGDVLAGIREHVEAELARRGVERATAEDMAEVLDRLGGPAQWAGAGDAGAASAASASRASSTVPSPAPSAGAAVWPWLALGLTLLGGVLVLLGFWWSWAPGWGLLVAGVVAARVSLAGEEPEPAPPGPARRMLLLVWGAAAVAGLLALLLAPAIATWVASQVGGPLEQALSGRPGVPGAPGEPGYWRFPLAVGASATAVWWLILAGLAVRFGDGARRALGPARSLLPRTTPQALAAGAVVAILSSLIAGVLT